MPSQPATTEKAYRADIDGLRALAILSVVLYHSGLPHLTGGFTGVDIFFVISGYLIGGQVWAELRTGAFTFAGFYRRRAKRILPAFYVVAGFTLAAGTLLLAPGELAHLARDTLAATLSVSNIVFWGTANYFTPRSELNPLLMTWSLGVEEQFYALIPVLMAIAARLRRAYILHAVAAVTAVSFALAWAASASYPMAVFYLLPARAWELGAGVLLAVGERDRRPKPLLAPWMREAGAWLALALMLAPVFVLGAATRLPGLVPLPSVAGAALAIALPSSFVNRRLFSTPPLRFLGKISYSWYLWHWPLLSLVHNLYGGALPAVRSAQTIALSCVLAVGSYYLIEWPFRGSRRAPVPLLVRYAAASGVAASLCAALWLSRGLPGRAPAMAGMEGAAHELESDPCLATLVRDTPNLSPACHDAAPSPLVALWGDSHAAALAPGLRVAAQGQGYRLALFAKASCPPLRGATHAIPRLPTLAAGCARFNREALTAITGDPRVRLVVLHATWAAPLDRDWQDGWLVDDGAAGTGPPTAGGDPPTEEADRRLFLGSLRAALTALRQAGKQIVVFEDTPAFQIDPAWRVKTQTLPVRRRLAQWLGVPDDTDPGFAPPDPDPRIAESTALLHEAVAGLDGVQLAGFETALCQPSGACEYRRGDTMLYVDSSHLSAAGAGYALRDFHLPLLAGPGSQ